jgi:hypothetical protein
MRMSRRKKLLVIGCGVFPVTYLLLYVINAAFGGYDPDFTSDGRSRYDGGLLMHDCIMWQPRFGSYYNEYRHDLIGLVFYPLLQLDHRYIHKTQSIADDDFFQWTASLTPRDIHPAYRAYWIACKAIDSKYQPQLAEAKAQGDTNEVRRIRSVMNEETYKARPKR